MNSAPRVVTLVEHLPCQLRPDDLSDEQAKVLFTTYPDRVTIEPPSFKNDQHWILVSQGWVGYLPVTPDLHLSLEPKVPIANLFQMLEYAYRLREFEFHGVRASGSLTEFYERVASILARRVLDRARRGFYASYVPLRETLPYVRGTVDLRHRLRRPWDVRIACDYQEHTADVEENQILAWTLSRIAHSGLCSDRVLPTVRRAFHVVQGMAMAVPFRASECVGRLYNRLNADYVPLHALCRFFLESAGPTATAGEHRMVPFIVDMSRLFELFVAEWLTAHLPAPLELRAKEELHVGEADRFRLEMDMVLYDRHSGRPLCVVDAKYKAPERPDNADLYQAVAYAEALGCEDAVLVYPTRVSTSADLKWGQGQKRIRTAVFSLDGDLERAGLSLMQELQIQ